METRPKAEPSLKELLALNPFSGGIENLEYQYDKVAQILELPKDWRLQACSRVSFQHNLCQARLEWCLKWLLKALTSSNSSGPYVRANVSTWVLLGQLISRLPVLLFTKILNANAFVICLRVALQENYGHESVDSLITALECSEHYKEQINQTALPEDRTSKIKSRCLISAIDEVIRLILGLASNRFNDSSLNEHIRSLLTTDISNAVQLFRLYVMALNKHLLVKSNEFSHGIDDNFIAPAALIWETSLENAETTTEMDLNNFSSHCTLPLLYTLIFLEESRSSIVHIYDVALVYKTRSAAEYLIVKYSLLSAPSYFIKSQKERERRREVALEAAVTEITHEVIRLADVTENLSASSEASVSVIACTVPLLFKLILRSKPAVNLGHSKSISTYFEPSFRILAASLATNRHQLTHRKIPDVCVLNLKLLIDIAVDQGMSLNKDTLKYIADQYCGLREEKSENINWSLIAALLRLPNDAFFHLMMEGVGRDYDKEQAGITLLDNVIHHLSQWSAEILLSRNSTGSSNNALEVYEEVKTSIFCPFIVSFIRVRKMKNLILLLRSELQKSFTSSKTSSELPTASLWEDDDLIKYTEQLLRSVINWPELLTLCRSEICVFEELFKFSNGGISSGKIGSPFAYYETRASLIILNVLLSLISNDDPAEELRAHLSTTISSLLNLANEFKSSFCMLTCDILRVMYQIYRLLWCDLDKIDNFTHGDQMFCLPWQISLYVFERQANNDDETDLADLQSQYITLSLLASSWYECYVRDMYECIPLGLAERMITHVNRILQTLSANNCIGSAENLFWNGNSRWIRSPWHLSLAIVSIFAQYPQLLNDCARESRKDFFSNCCKLAVHSDVKYGISDAIAGTTHMGLLVALNDWIASCPQIELRGDFLSVLTGLIKSSSESSNGFTQRTSIIAEEQILLMNPSIIRREYREIALDVISDVKEVQQANELVRRLSLMVHLMESPNATAGICSNAQVLWMVAERIDAIQLTDSRDLWQLQDDLTQKILTHILRSQHQPHSQSFLQDYTLMLQKVISEQKSYLSAIGTLSIVDTSIRLLRAHDLLPAGSEEMLGVALRSDLTQVDGHQYQSSGSGILNQIEAILTTMLSNQISPIHLAQMVSVANVLTVDYPASSSFIRILCLLILHENNPRQIRDIYKRISVKNKWKGLTRDLCLFSSILCKNQLLFNNNGLELGRQLQVDANNVNPSTHLFILREILLFPSTCPRISILEMELSTLLIRLCDTLFKMTVPHDILMVLDCINVLLLNYRQTLSQYDIEVVLSMITCSVTEFRLAFPKSSANYAFIRLCTTTRILILVYRTKLRGRHHLLLQSLKALLAAFFLPYELGRRPSLTRGMTGASTEALELDRHCAEAFCRVLTLWCAPPPSSIKAYKSYSEPNLTDHAQKIRTYAGKFVFNILEHYCVLQLSGRIKPEVRETLLPGLFTMLDITKAEAMNTLNSRLGVSAQALWKTLYDEWKRSNRHSG